MAYPCGLGVPMSPVLPSSGTSRKEAVLSWAGFRIPGPGGFGRGNARAQVNANGCQDTQEGD